MKIQKFLIWIQDKMINYPDISFQTIKMFIDKFKTCLSEKELERNSLYLQLISEISSKAMSLDYFVANHKINNLESELNELKNDKNDTE